MLKLVSALGIAATAFSVTHAQALPNPSIGIDGQITRHHWEKEFGDKIFRKQVPTTNLQLGFDFNPYWGIEFGYEVSPGKRKITRLDSGTILGDPLTLTPEYFWSSIKSRGYSVAAKTQYPLTDDSKFFLKLGLIHSHITHEMRQIEDRDVAYNFISSHRIYHAHRVIMKHSLGYQHNINDSFGWRMGVNWYNHGKFKKIPEKRRLGRGLLVSMHDSVGFFFGFYALGS
ncbi:MAG: hypothetical protein ACKOAD_00095 [Gammaproteobacteria bacterium]